MTAKWLAVGWLRQRWQRASLRRTCAFTLGSAHAPVMWVAGCWRGGGRGVVQGEQTAAAGSSGARRAMMRVLDVLVCGAFTCLPLFFHVSRHGGAAQRALPDVSRQLFVAAVHGAEDQHLPHQLLW